ETDIQASRETAKRLLAEAGVPALKLKLLNRNVQTPYVPLGVYVIDQWRQIGVGAEMAAEETGPYFAALTNGNFDAAIDFWAPSMDEPTILLTKYLPGSANNYAHNADPTLGELYQRQMRALDPAERRALVSAFEKHVLTQGYVAPLFWAER